MIKFFVEGTPEGQPRPRTGMYGNIYSPQKQWNKVVYWRCLKHKPLQTIDFPVFVSLTFSMRKPKSVPKKKYWHTKKPDFDNLAKGTIDALTKAKFWTDDNLICMCLVKKHYGNPAGCYIEITRLKEVNND